MVHLLLVEDDEAIRRSLSRGLVEQGATVSTAGTAVEAIQALAVEKPDAVVLDLGLPDLDGADVLALIRAGGPFQYSQDDQVFGNFERILPARDRGYYREYTVPTPGEPDRGARRIVAGNGGEKYYTGDHYTTFKYIAEGS